MLFSFKRLFLLSDKQRLPAILADSRKYQNLVSTQLAEQVLAALYELVRGFQAADDQRRGDLLREVLADDPNHVYAGLLTVLMRLVFVLYAEDRDLLSNDEVYQKYYSVTGLFERLREDAGRHTDTMDHRYGAWAQLLTLFRLIHDGGRHGGMKLLARKGYLFDPDRYPFLEGRPKGSKRQPGERTDPPHVSDGVVFRVLHNLLILDGERLSYRTLDVEQIGSVYETMMGFNLEVAQGRSIAIKPTKAHGAPTTINLDELLAGQARRAGEVAQAEDRPGAHRAGRDALKEAETLEDAVAALEKKVAKAATPRIVPPGAMVLQPSDERREIGFALHPAFAHRADRPHDTCADPGATRGSADAGADSRPESLRPGDGLGRVPGRSLPPARRRAGQGLARARLRCRRSRRMRTSCSTPAASSPSAACTAWTRTRWRSTSPSSRSGWRPWRRTTPSRSSTMPCGAAIRWSGSRRLRSSDSTGSPTSSGISRGPRSRDSSTGRMEQRRQIREAPDGTSDALLAREARRPPTGS